MAGVLLPMAVTMIGRMAGVTVTEAPVQEVPKSLSVSAVALSIMQTALLREMLALLRFGAGSPAMAHISTGTTMGSAASSPYRLPKPSKRFWPSHSADRPVCDKDLAVSPAG